MFAHERHHFIVDLLSNEGRLTVGDLTERLGISPATLRRDLAALERSERVIRVHGGVLAHRRIPDEPSFQEKTRTSAAVKCAIARIAAERVPANATVFIDGGTTCMEVGALLKDREDVTLITNSIPLLARCETFSCRIIALGGEVRHVSKAMVGGLTTELLGKMRADIAFVGASALDPNAGAFTTELLEASVKREWIRNSRQPILLADATKWESTAAVGFAQWDDFAGFITDAPPPARIKGPTVTILKS